MYRYRLGDADIASQLVLDGLPEAETRTEAHITIRIGTPAAVATLWLAQPEGAEPSPDWATIDYLRSEDGGWYRIRYDYRGHVADFAIRSDGREIILAAGEGATDAEVANLIEGPILGRAMRLAGRPCLHATALASEGRAIALMGASGVGKSSLAWALVQQGCGLVTDDMVGLTPGPGGLMVQPGRARLRMWPDTAERLGVAGTIACPLFPTASEMGKIGVRDAASLENRAVPLHAIYKLLPRAHGSGRAEIGEVPTGQRLAELGANLHGRIPPARDGRKRELAFLAQVAASVPMRLLTLPGSLDALPGVAADLRCRLFE